MKWLGVCAKLVSLYRNVCSLKALETTVTYRLIANVDFFLLPSDFLFLVDIV